MTVELIKPHTHAGVRYAPGTHLDVDEATARWLIDHAVALEVAVADATPKLATPVRKGD
ncbi:MULTISPECIES: DUF7210 family protein [Burkholderiales]|jgi:hypothetical protein|uniref:DUF7210 family protein n=1 Tax=Burkholderiales TaxID=80840 RepID=UPI001C947157|nr:MULTISPECIES: hypothetical protein [Burkholderiales]MBY4833944.1 hypothetical protein [Burkholderia dolosa]